MLTVQILEADDIIQPEDWCRPLTLVSMSGGHSDDYSFKSCYSGRPENNVQWVLAKHVLGDPWFDKPTTVKELYQVLHTRYEFVRGEIPKQHKLPLRGYNIR